MEDIDLDQLPVPDWGLNCPKCRYPLRGLPGHTCPECGRAFKPEELVHSWTRLRDPRLSGGELPLPDFGVVCAACGMALAGAKARCCPVCGAAFEPLSWRPAGVWFVIDGALAGGLPMPLVEMLLSTEAIPYLVYDGRTVVDIYTGGSALGSKLLAASEFWYDFREAVTRTRREMTIDRQRQGASAWRCGGCGETVPAHFEICWNCERGRSA